MGTIQLKIAVNNLVQRITDSFEAATYLGPSKETQTDRQTEDNQRAT